MITNYTDLVATLTGPSGWLRRPDLATQVSVYVQLAEAEMNRLIRARRKIVRTTWTIDAEFFDLPDDFGGLRTIRRADTPNGKLDIVTAEQMADLKDQCEPTGGLLLSVAVVGDELEVYKAPAASTDVAVTYYQKIAPLETSATNWVLTDHPDLYLEGAMWKANAYLKNAELAVAYRSSFLAIIDEINSASIAESMGGYGRGSPSTRPV